MRFASISMFRDDETKPWALEVKSYDASAWIQVSDGRPSGPSIGLHFGKKDIGRYERAVAAFNAALVDEDTFAPCDVEQAI